MSLLQRQREPDVGRITVDGHDLLRVSLTSLRASIAVVFQDAGLFNRSIADNLRLARPDASDAELEQAGSGLQGSGPEPDLAGCGGRGAAALGPRAGGRGGEADEGLEQGRRSRAQIGAGLKVRLKDSIVSPHCLQQFPNCAVCKLAYTTSLYPTPGSVVRMLG